MNDAHAIEHYVCREIRTREETDDMHMQMHIRFLYTHHDDQLNVRA